MPGEIKRFAANATIFKEGDPADHAFIVLKGSVDVFIQRAGKTITVDSFKAGQCFGEMGPLTNQPRSANAKAKEPAELLVMSLDDVRTTLNQKDPIARTIVQALVERLRKALSGGAFEQLLPTYPLASYARLLVILAQSAPAGRPPGQPEHQTGSARISAAAAQAAPPPTSPAVDEAKLSFDKAIEAMSEILNQVGYQLKETLLRMESLNLLRIESAPEGKYIRFRSSEIVENSARLQKSLGALVEQRLFAEVAVCDIDELARELGFDPDKGLQKLLAGSFPRDMVLFKRELALDLVRRHGSAFFEQS